MTPIAHLPEPTPAPQKKRRKKKRRAERIRGVETMYRTALQESAAHTQLADNKANMMISINGVILSLLLAFSQTILSAGPHLAGPCAVLLATAMGSVICSLLAATPRLPFIRISTADLRSDRHNPLFFGATEQVCELEYADVIAEMCQDPDRLYRNMSRRMHGMRRGLMRKFRLLRYAYLIFLVGLCGSAATFLGALTLGGGVG